MESTSSQKVSGQQAKCIADHNTFEGRCTSPEVIDDSCVLLVICRPCAMTHQEPCDVSLHVLAIRLTTLAETSTFELLYPHQSDARSIAQTQTCSIEP